jgi:hypothetical protein
MRQFLFVPIFLFSLNLSFGQYCAAPHINTCVQAELVTALTLSGTSFAPTMPTACNGLNYAFPNTPANVMELGLGLSQLLAVTPSAGGVAQCGSIWIDFNQDSVFSASEWFDLGRALPLGTTVYVPILTPTNAILGRTKARLRFRRIGNTNAPTDACIMFGSGFTYDFNVNITPSSICNATPPTPLLDKTVMSLCANDSVAISYVNAGPSVGNIMLWQTSTDNGVTWVPAP